MRVPVQMECPGCKADPTTIITPLLNLEFEDNKYYCSNGHVYDKLPGVIQTQEEVIQAEEPPASRNELHQQIMQPPPGLDPVVVEQAEQRIEVQQRVQNLDVKAPEIVDGMWKDSQADLVIGPGKPEPKLTAIEEELVEAIFERANFASQPAHEQFSELLLSMGPVVCRGGDVLVVVRVPEKHASTLAAEAEVSNRPFKEYVQRAFDYLLENEAFLNAGV